MTVPSGSVTMGDHLWVSDHTMGFCRVDGTTVNQNVCAAGPVSPGQPAFDASRNLVYVPDNSAKSLGVYRLRSTQSPRPSARRRCWRPARCRG